MLDSSSLKNILKNIRQVRAVILGDISIKAVWKQGLIDDGSKNHRTVTDESYLLGSGAEIALNISSLSPQEVRLVSMIGNDWRAEILKDLLKRSGISTDWLLSSDELVTPLRFIEQSDNSSSDNKGLSAGFENTRAISTISEIELKRKIYEAKEGADIIVVCDDLFYGCITPGIIEMLSDIGLSVPVIASSTYRTAMFRNVIVTPDIRNVSKDLDIQPPQSIAEIKKACERLKSETKSPVVLTLGRSGAAYLDDDGFFKTEAFNLAPISGSIKSAFVSAFSMAYSSGNSWPKLFGGSNSSDIIQFACLVSALKSAKQSPLDTVTPEEMIRFMDNYYR